MKKLFIGFLFLVMLVTLTACGGDEASIYNFESRRDGTLFYNGVMIDYKTNTDGKLIELNIDRLLTIEEMMLYNPIIDWDYQLAGFSGNIFMSPSNECTSISDDMLIPINIEVGNTRYKFDNTSCRYKTVDNNNVFKAGYADEYFLSSTIKEDKNTTISIIVYNPLELVKFVEIYQIVHTQELLGVYGTIHLRDNEGRYYDDHNYYTDMGIYEQLYLKHQENEATIDEISGIPTDINIMDMQNLTEVIPLIDDFATLYAFEISAMEQLQQTIGINFENTETDETSNE